MNIEQQFSGGWITCPNTGYQMHGEQLTTHAIPGGWAVWWRCSTCHRWHVKEIPLKQKETSSPISGGG